MTPDPIDLAAVREASQDCRHTYHFELADMLNALTAEVERLRADVAKGDAFKTFVHAYLDAHGVPHGDPTNKHQQEGCRIGARLDLLLAQRNVLGLCCQEARELLGEADATDTIPRANLEALRALLWRASLRHGRARLDTPPPDEVKP